MSDVISCWAPDGIGEIEAGADLARIVADAVGAATGHLEAGDIVVVSSKVVAKAEGRLVAAASREDVITAETVRIVASRRRADGSVTRIVENRLGIVQAAAGVDASNVPEGHVLLLPVDPDTSARTLCAALRAASGVPVGVLITDTLGRAWRRGQTDAAIGAAGMRVVDDLRGTADANGVPLGVTIVAIADEIAGLADLAKGKASGRPVAVVRGLGRYVDDVSTAGARSIVRTGPDDMFRLGADEAYADGYRDGYEEGARETARFDTEIESRGEV